MNWRRALNILGISMIAATTATAGILIYNHVLTFKQPILQQDSENTKNDTISLEPIDLTNPNNKIKFKSYNPMATGIEDGIYQIKLDQEDITGIKSYAGSTKILSSSVDVQQSPQLNIIRSALLEQFSFTPIPKEGSEDIYDMGKNNGVFKYTDQWYFSCWLLSNGDSYDESSDPENIVGVKVKPYSYSINYDTTTEACIEWESRELGKTTLPEKIVLPPVYTNPRYIETVDGNKKIHPARLKTSDFGIKDILQILVLEGSNLNFTELNLRFDNGESGANHISGAFIEVKENSSIYNNNGNRSQIFINLVNALTFDGAPINLKAGDINKEIKFKFSNKDVLQANEVEVDILYDNLPATMKKVNSANEVKLCKSEEADQANIILQKDTNSWKLSYTGFTNVQRQGNFFENMTITLKATYKKKIKKDNTELYTIPHTATHKVNISRNGVGHEDHTMTFNKIANDELLSITDVNTTDLVFYSEDNIKNIEDSFNGVLLSNNANTNTKNGEYYIGNANDHTFWEIQNKTTGFGIIDHDNITNYTITDGTMPSDPSISIPTNSELVCSGNDIVKDINPYGVNLGTNGFILGTSVLNTNPVFACTVKPSVGQNFYKFNDWKKDLSSGEKGKYSYYASSLFLVDEYDNVLFLDVNDNKVYTKSSKKPGDEFTGSKAYAKFVHFYYFLFDEASNADFFTGGNPKTLKFSYIPNYTS